MSDQIGTVLVLDVWSDYAHFRKPYTTSSPLTFAVPPRTALAGMLGAFVGLQKDEYLQHFTRDHASIAVSISPSATGICKTRIPENYIDTKDSGSEKMCKIKNHTQINMEVVYAPKYRVFVRHTEQTVLDSLRSNLSQHRSFYTPYLGISEFIAGFAFVGEFACSDLPVPTSPIQISSVVPIAGLEPNSVMFEAGPSGAEYLKDRMPGEMLPGRITTTYDEILYERHGNPISARPKVSSSVLMDPPVVVMWL